MDAPAISGMAAQLLSGPDSVESVEGRAIFMWDQAKPQLAIVSH